jgi:hypothetical protein
MDVNVAVRFAKTSCDGRRTTTWADRGTIGDDFLTVIIRMHNPMVNQPSRHNPMNRQSDKRPQIAHSFRDLRPFCLPVGTSFEAGAEITDLAERKRPGEAAHNSIEKRIAFDLAIGF